MNSADTRDLTNRGKIIRQGLICQSVMSGVAISFCIWTGSLLYASIALIACSWIPVWLIMFFKTRILDREAGLLQKKTLTSLEEAEIDYIQRAKLNIDKRWTLSVELVFSAILLIGGWVVLDKTLTEGVFYSQDNVLIPLGLSAMFAFCALTATFYFNQLIKTCTDKQYLQSGVLGISSFSIVLSAATLSLCGEYIKIPKILFFATIVFAGLGILVGLEAVIKMFFRFFRPRVKGEYLRPAFESYILEGLKRPGNINRIFADVVNHQLGFDASRSTFFRMFGTFALPFVFFTILLIFGISSVVTVSPAKRALVLRFGNMTDRILEPGIHLKAPWPIDIIREFDVWEIKRVHVGSHQPAKPTEEIYKKNKPILWTNLHGIVVDELLIVAPPADLMNKVDIKIQNDNEKAPSVSLAGADILVEYRIKDLNLYVTSCIQPDEYFKQIAEAESSRAMYKYDIDSLFCEGRIKLPEILQNRIQKVADKVKLGIEVLNVGIGGVHPPQTVSSAFQETVAALQEKETDIQLAQQYKVMHMIETVGTMKEAGIILKAINLMESNVAENKKIDTSLSPAALLRTSSGYVAEILAKANSYRWKRENKERGKADRFKKELLLYNVAPKTYLADCYFSVLETGLEYSEKYMLVGTRDNLILRFDFTDLSDNYDSSDKKENPQLFEE